MSKVAFVTGATGQDASYLMDLLLSKGYEVYGLVRRSASPNHWRIKHLEGKVGIIYGDLNDQSSLDNAIRTIHPDEVYNLAAQSFVQYSFQAPIATIEATGVGVIKLLEAVKNNHKEAKVFQASTSEMFGKVRETPQKETTHFYPRSPYGCAKAMAHYACVNYREAYDMHISCGIMFNHESPRRGEEFVTRKITKGIAEFKKTGKKISLGNLNASRDWSHSKEVMQGAWLMLQQDKPRDFVLGSGITHTVKEWLEKTCEVAGVEFFEAFTQNPAFERQSEVDYLRADPSLAFSVLGWKTKVSFDELVEEMYKADEALSNNSVS
mgnify:CR=1 FL=1